MVRTLRWLMFVALLVAPVRATPAETVASLPQPTGYVDDFAGVLTPETKQSLEDLCTQVDQRAHAQIAVVTIKSIDPDKSGATPSIEEFANDLFQKWGVGNKKTDGGVLLIVSLNPRKYRIEVGYGMEGILNDAKVGDIGRDMQPYLHTGDYNQGISLAVRELSQDIAADAGVNLGLDQNAAPAPQNSYHYDNGPPQQISLLPVLIFGGIAIVVIAILIRTGHIGLLFFFLFNILGGGRGGGGGFGGGDGEGGGGFGGFGGGSSGGGGASGDF